MRNISMMALLIGIVAVTSGCATNRGYLHVNVPRVEKPQNAVNQVFIRSVEDVRVFQDNPSSADIPSLGFGGLEKADAGIKLRAIARKRNGFGKALGDILLDEQQSVPLLVYDMLKSSLYLLGYDVTNDSAQAKSDAVALDVKVDKFWGWLSPGFWTLAMNNEIVTTIHMGSRAPVVISTKAVNHCQVGDTRNWQKVFNMGAERYVEEARKALAEELADK